MNTLSILKDTNKLITSSEDNLSCIRSGSFIKLGNDSVIYTIAKTNKISFTSDFDVQTPTKLLINDNTNIKLQKNDVIKISYKEYELDHVSDIKDCGKLYVLNDEVTIRGGESVIDIQTGLENQTKLLVNGTNENGGITELKLKNNGKYIIFPPNPCELFGGHGENCLLNLNYKISNSSTETERKIQDINILEDKTYITLNYPVFDKLINGTIFVEKWEILLSSNYVGESKVNVNYEIFKDFTPNLHLPLLVKNSQSIDLIFNKVVNMLENEIMQLKRGIK